MPRAFLLDRGGADPDRCSGRHADDCQRDQRARSGGGLLRRRRRHAPWFPVARRSVHHHRLPRRPATSLTGINNRGQIVGVYGPTTEPVLHGFLLSGGALRHFRRSGRPCHHPARHQRWRPDRRLHDQGAEPRPLRWCARIPARQGRKRPFTPIDFPGASLTAAGGIDDRGRIVGTYQNAAAAPDRQPSPCGCR